MPPLSVYAFDCTRVSKDGDMPIKIRCTMRGAQRKTAAAGNNNSCPIVGTKLAWNRNSCWVDAFIVAVMHSDDYFMDMIDKAEFTNKYLKEQSTRYECDDITARHKNLESVAKQIKIELNKLRTIVRGSDPPACDVTKCTCDNLRQLFFKIDPFKCEAEESRGPILKTVMDYTGYTQFFPHTPLELLNMIFDIITYYMFSNVITENVSLSPTQFNTEKLPLYFLSIERGSRFNENNDEDAAPPKQTRKQNKNGAVNVSKAAYLVTFPKELKGPLKLRSIIVHNGTTGNGGHYVTYISCGDQWFLIDNYAREDRMRNVPIIGGWRTIADDPIIQQNVVMLYYTRDT